MSDRYRFLKRAVSAQIAALTHSLAHVGCAASAAGPVTRTRRSAGQFDTPAPCNLSHSGQIAFARLFVVMSGSLVRRCFRGFAHGTRCHVSADVHDVFRRQLLHGLLHQRSPQAVAGAVLDVVKLPSDIAW